MILKKFKRYTHNLMTLFSKSIVIHLRVSFSNHKSNSEKNLLLIVFKNTKPKNKKICNIFKRKLKVYKHLVCWIPVHKFLLCQKLWFSSQRSYKVK